MVTVLLVVSGLILCAAGGQPLPLMVVLSGALLFPLFLSRYEPVMQNGRYLMPLIPVCLAAAGAGLAALARPRWVLPQQAGAILAGAVVIGVVGWHIAAVASFLQTSIEQGLTNQRYYWAESVLLAAAPSEEILLDQDLVGRGTGGGGDLLKQFRYLLETHDMAYRIVDRPARPSGTAGQTRVIVIRSASLSDFSPSMLFATLLPAVDRPRGANFGIYRVQYPAAG